MCAKHLKRHSRIRIVNIAVNLHHLTFDNSTSVLSYILVIFHCASYVSMPKMAKTKQIPLEKRAQIVILHKTGKSQVEIARILGVSRKGVQTTLNRHSETNSYSDRKRSGRPKKTTKIDDRQIEVLSKRSRMKTAPDIAAEINQSLDKSISVSTVKNRLRSAGLFGRVAARKPYLSSENKRKRLAWAKLHKNWTIEDWKQVLWSDESKFEFFGSKRRQYVRRKQGERYKPECLQSTVKFGGGKINVWGCFSYDGVGTLYKIEGIMKKEDYHQILQRHAIPSGLRLIGKGFVFQQDNDPKHTSNMCKNYLESKEASGLLKVMKWPPQSPDANPIEKLWDELDRQRQEKRPTSETDLWNIIKDVWNGLKPEILRKLVERLPRICEAIIKARGGHIDEKKLI